MNNFAVYDIAYTHYLGGIYITLKTSTPCHLTCYHTKSRPGRHQVSRNDRGLVLPWGAYYCFVAWTQVEQTEPGDTTFHTFDITPWPTYQVKWFCFRGTIGGVLSPSVSPIFEHQQPQATRMDAILRVIQPGDFCSRFLDGTGPPCPHHWQSVTTLDWAPPDWYLRGATLNRRWKWDTYFAETGRLEQIESVTHCIRARRHGGYAYVRVIRHLLWINGTKYIYTVPSTPEEWKDYEWVRTTNPDTGLPWTSNDVNGMQVGIELRQTTSVGWTATGYCDEVYLKVKRSIIYPP